MANYSSLSQFEDPTTAVKPSQDKVIGDILTQQYLQIVAPPSNTPKADGVKSQSGTPKSPGAPDASSDGQAGSVVPLAPVETIYDSWKKPLPTDSVSNRLSGARQDLLAKSKTMVGLISDNVETFYRYDGLEGVSKTPIFKTDIPQVVEGKEFLRDDIWGNPSFDNFHFSFFNESTALDGLSDFQSWLPKATERFDDVLKWADVAEHFSELDKNKNGILDRSELAAKYDPAKYPDFYKEFDTLASANKNSNSPGVSKANIENFVGNEMVQGDNRYVMGLYEKNFEKDSNQFEIRMTGLFDKLDTNSDGKIDKTELTNAIKDPAAPVEEKAMAQIVLDNYAGFSEAAQRSSWLEWPKPTSIDRNAFWEFRQVALFGPQDSSNVSSSQTKKAIVELLENNLLP